jgi:ribonuclease D
MDRSGDRRLAALKQWRTRRAGELEMDPGVLCPNSALEAIAVRTAQGASNVEPQNELKRWFVREFGGEVAAALAEVDASPNEG